MYASKNKIPYVPEWMDKLHSHDLDDMLHVYFY